MNGSQWFSGVLVLLFIAQIRKFLVFFSYCSLDFEECAHKLLKMDFPESQTVSLFFVVAINMKQL